MAVVALDDGATDIEAQAQAVGRALVLGNARHAIEAVPQVFLLGGGEARAVIFHLKDSLMIFFMQPDLDAGVGGGIFEGVAQEVGHDLTDAVGVGAIQQGRRR